MPKLKRNNSNGSEPMILFQCTTCKLEELIPKSVVDFFDVMDGGDSSVPPRFDCSSPSCSFGKMHPVHYVGHDGITYSL